MNQITKKILPEYFQAIVDGKKTFELRLNDFDIQEGDILILEEWTTSDPLTRVKTGRTLQKTVVGVSNFKIKDLWFSEEELMKKGLKIISFS